MTEDLHPVIHRDDSGRESLRLTVERTIKTSRESLLALSHDIHRSPETAFNEHGSCQLVADELERAGFDVTTGVYGLTTAIEASFGSGDVVVAICAEYDALPEIGHACGHNMIAAAAVGAAMALAEVATDLGITVRLLGTPAEEHGGGKIIMLENGAWEGVDFSMMVHGASGDDIEAESVRSHAVERFRICFEGLAAHASSAPHDGVNAGDAATISLAAIGLLRQQLRHDVRISAFVAEGGTVTNVVPAYSEVHVEVRSLDNEEWKRSVAKVLRCFEAGALATGCSWRRESMEPDYEPLLQNPILGGIWDQNLRRLGRSPAPRFNFSIGSTDMGNVSHVVPSIHPIIAILGSTDAPHTPKFALLAATEAADEATLDGAIAMAWTVVDIMVDPLLRDSMAASGPRSDHQISGGQA